MPIDVLIINPDLAVRGRLKQIVSAISEFGRVVCTSTLREGLDRLSLPQPLQAIYLSSKFDPPVVEQFVVSGKATRGGSDSAYMMMLGENDASRERITSYAVRGVDGFVVEPFSAESVLSATKMAISSRTVSRTDQRLRAIEAIVDGSITAVDVAASSSQEGTMSIRSRKALERTRALLEQLPPELLSLYYERVIEKFGSISAPKVTRAGQSTSSSLPRRVVKR